MVYNKYLLKAMSGEYVILLHNGYDSFSYGNVTNPIVLNFSEYELLKSYFFKINQNSFFENFEQSDKYDLEFPTEFLNILGVRLLTLSAKECFRYLSEEDKQKSEKEKRKLIEKFIS